MDVGLVSPASDTSLSVKLGGLTALLNGRHREQPEQSNNKLTLRVVSVDTVLLRRCYLLFFINVTTREVYFAGIAAYPTGAWTTQAARNPFPPSQRTTHRCTGACW